jgi:hypothetical protein
MKAVGFNWDIHSALRSMSRAAAEHLLLLDGEVEGLRATVARLEGHLQDREGKQQRQETMQEEMIADLQGGGGRAEVNGCSIGSPGAGAAAAEHSATGLIGHSRGWKTCGVAFCPGMACETA